MHKRACKTATLTLIQHTVPSGSIGPTGPASYFLLKVGEARATSTEFNVVKKGESFQEDLFEFEIN